MINGNILSVHRLFKHGSTKCRTLWIHNQFHTTQLFIFLFLFVFIALIFSNQNYFQIHREEWLVTFWSNGMFFLKFEWEVCLRKCALSCCLNWSLFLEYVLFFPFSDTASLCTTVALFWCKEHWFFNNFSLSTEWNEGLCFVFCKLHNIFHDLLASLATDLQLSSRYYKYEDWKLNTPNAQGREQCFTYEDRSRQDIIHVCGSSSKVSVISVLF
jgi:hypothetical protein